MSLPLVITRAEEDGEPLLGRLRAAGLDAYHAPCITRVSLEVDPHLLDAWRGHPARVGLTSPYAVPPLVRLGADPAWEIRALAPRTAEAACRAGLPVHVWVRGGAAALAADTRDRVFLLLGSDQAGEEARRANPDLIHLTVYQVRPPARLSLPDGRFDVFFASPSAVHGFVALAGPARSRVRRCLTHGGTTTDAAHAAGLNPEPCSIEDLVHAASTPPASL